MKISVLSKSETADAVEKMVKSWPEGSIPKVKNFKVYEIDSDTSLLAADGIAAVQTRGVFIPFLREPELLAKFPSVTVDMGAIKYVCNGAKVMRPGIVSIGDFKKEDIVVVKDQIHNKMLAVGLALEDSESAKSMTKGYVIDNLHYISDKVWEAFKDAQPTRS